MKNVFFYSLITALLTISGAGFARAQRLPSKSKLLQKNTWTESQLIKPYTLVEMIEVRKKIKIYNIGVVQDIKGAIHLGAASEEGNLKRFQKVLQTLPENTAIVVYCGCCPMDKCPNIGPAFQLLNDLKFKNAKLLDLPVNIKTDWIDKGYPLAGNTK